MLTIIRICKYKSSWFQMKTPSPKKGMDGESWSARRSINKTRGRVALWPCHLHEKVS